MTELSHWVKFLMKRWLKTILTKLRIGNSDRDIPPSERELLREESVLRDGFDREYYLAMYPDVKKGGQDPTEKW